MFRDGFEGFDNRHKHRRLLAAAKMMSYSLPMPDDSGNSMPSSSSSSSSSSRGFRQRKYSLAARAASFGNLPCLPLASGTDRWNGRRRVLSENSPRTVTTALSSKVGAADTMAATASRDVKRTTYGAFRRQCWFVQKILHYSAVNYSGQASTPATVNSLWKCTHCIMYYLAVIIRLYYMLVYIMISSMFIWNFLWPCR